MFFNKKEKIIKPLDPLEIDNTISQLKKQEELMSDVLKKIEDFDRIKEELKAFDALKEEFKVVNEKAQQRAEEGVEEIKKDLLAEKEKLLLLKKSYLDKKKKTSLLSRCYYYNDLISSKVETVRNDITAFEKKSPLLSSFFNLSPEDVSLIGKNIRLTSFVLSDFLIWSLEEECFPSASSFSLYFELQTGVAKNFIVMEDFEKNINSFSFIYNLALVKLIKSEISYEENKREKLRLDVIKLKKELGELE